MKEMNLNLDAFEIIKPNKNKHKIIKTFILPQDTVDKINEIAKLKSIYKQTIKSAVISKESEVKLNV